VDDLVPGCLKGLVYVSIKLNHKKIIVFVEVSFLVITDAETTYNIQHNTNVLFCNLGIQMINLKGLLEVLILIHNH
jgi:hypothetical protein